jgi:hypothetical protein
MSFRTQWAGTARSTWLGFVLLAIQWSLYAAVPAVAAALDQDRPNIVITSDLATVSTEGAFERVTEQLSRGRQSLLGSGAGPHRVSFRATPDLDGYYRVFVWWPQIRKGAGDADVVIHHFRGESTLTVDQRVRSGQWNGVGIFEFAGHQAQIDLAGHPGSTLGADAVRLQYMGAQMPPLAFETTALPVSLVGERYGAQLEVIAGTAPITFAVDARRLPPGLTLDPATGNIAGAASVAGSYAFDVEAFDKGGQRAIGSFVIDVIAESAGQSTSKARVAHSSTGTTTKDGVASGTPPDLSNLVSVVAAMPEGEWTQASLNSYSDVWTPPDLRPLYGLSNPDPGRIITAWSSFAWDPNHGDLWLFGGGHANYPGNDVYRWRGTTRQWERASLPSEIKQDDLGNWQAVDGWDAAPASAHTYDNNMFFPHIDRFVVFGGAAFNSGTAWKRELTATTNRRTGPFFFDPSKANAGKVGGTTGSQVMRVAPHPEIVGGNMWSNRDIYVNIPGAPALPGTQVNGCTAYADENGKDVAYIGAQATGGSTNLNLYRYTVNSLASPQLDTFQTVGIFWNGTAGRTACGVDPVRKLFVRIGDNANPLIYWNLNTPGTNNKDVRVTPVDPTGEFASLLASNQITMQACSLDFDPARSRFALWCGDGRVWMITPPAAASATGWTIVKQRVPARATPNGDVGTGLLGKWKYIPNIDAFIGLQDSLHGNIWIYKPVGWANPLGGNGISAPTGVSASDGTSASSVAVTWNASANATGYTIYRSTTAGVQGGAIGTSSATSFTDTTPTPGTTYYYGVTATGPSGTSPLSAQDSGFASAATLAAPTQVNASDGTSASSVTIAWAAVSGATGYTVYRSGTSGVQGASIGTTNTTTLVDTSATPGTTYFYGVTASGPGGPSTLSVQDSGYVALGAPGSGALGGTASISSTDVNLTAAGAVDWAHWWYFNHKAGGAFISTYTRLGSGTVTNYYGDPRSFSWNNGTPYYTGNDDFGVQTSGIGNGFSFTVAADTTTRTLLVYIGGVNSTGKLTAHLSDATAADFVDASLSGSARYDGLYTLTYRAGSAGQQLQISWTQAAGSGNVSLQAVALR